MITRVALRCVLLWLIAIQLRRTGGAGVGLSGTLGGAGEGPYVAMGASFRGEWIETPGHEGERGRIHVHIHARHQAWSTCACSPGTGC